MSMKSMNEPVSSEVTKFLLVREISSQLVFFAKVPGNCLKLAFFTFGCIQAVWLTSPAHLPILVATRHASTLTLLPTAPENPSLKCVTAVTCESFI